MLNHIKDQSAFEPDQIMATSEAFVASCNTLCIFAGDAHGR